MKTKWTKDDDKRWDLLVNKALDNNMLKQSKKMAKDKAYTSILDNSLQGLEGYTKQVIERQAPNKATVLLGALGYLAYSKKEKQKAWILWNAALTAIDPFSDDEISGSFKIKAGWEEVEELKRYFYNIISKIDILVERAIEGEAKFAIDHLQQIKTKTKTLIKKVEAMFYDKSYPNLLENIITRLDQTMGYVEEGDFTKASLAYDDYHQKLEQLFNKLLASSDI